MQQNKKHPIWVTILCDFLIFAILLSVFCYYHHIKRLWGPIFGKENDKGPKVIGEITKPPKKTETDEKTETTEFTTDETTEQNETNFDTSVTKDTENGTNHTEPQETEPVETEPQYDKSGDFGYKFYYLFAQGDEVEVTDTYYKSKDIYLTVTEVRDVIDGKNILYYVFDVYVRNIENLFTHIKNPRDQFTNLVKETNPILAISGDNWNYSNKTQIAIRNGYIIRDSDSLRTGDDICIVYWDGKMETISSFEYDYDEIISKAPYQVWHFGPSLIDKNGKAKTDFPYSKSISEEHPRSSIGYFEPGHYAFVVADGRSYESGKGITLKMLAQIYEDLGCIAAYNFDGGDSAFAYYNGEVLREDYERSQPGKKHRDIGDIIAIGEIR